MKWAAAQFSRQEKRRRRMKGLNTWHRRFAWLPTIIPEQKFDSIVVHRHWLWLEFYAEISRDRDCRGPWDRKTYAGELSIRQMAKSRSFKLGNYGRELVPE